MSDKLPGLPAGFLLIPAREYTWERLHKIQIRIPNKGKVTDLVTPEEQAQGLEIPGPDTFSLFEDNCLLLWETVRILFASGQYPDLADDQCLNVLALEIEGDEVVVHGEVLRSIT